MGEACGANGEYKNVYMISVVRPEKRALGRPRHRWVDNTEIDHGEI
jgi:hypothetical protein